MIDYTVNDYGPLNRAIEVETEKYRTLNSKRLGKAFLYVCAGLGCLALTIALSYATYRYFSSDLEARGRPVAASDKAEDLSNLRALGGGEESRNERALGINAVDKEYTAFMKVQADSGEIIVTGRKFVSDNLSKPYLQYCYLEGAGRQLTGLQLAELNSDGSLEYFQDDETLRRYANDYCRFYK